MRPEGRFVFDEQDQRIYPAPMQSDAIAALLRPYGVTLLIARHHSFLAWSLLNLLQGAPQRCPRIALDISNARYIDQPLIFVTTVYNRCP